MYNNVDNATFLDWRLKEVDSLFNPRSYSFTTSTPTNLESLPKDFENIYVNESLDTHELDVYGNLYDDFLTGDYDCKNGGEMKGMPPRSKESAKPLINNKRPGHIKSLFNPTMAIELGNLIEEIFDSYLERNIEKDKLKSILNESVERYPHLTNGLGGNETGLNDIGFLSNILNESVNTIKMIPSQMIELDVHQENDTMVDGSTTFANNIFKLLWYYKAHHFQPHNNQSLRVRIKQKLKWYKCNDVIPNSIAMNLMDPKFPNGAVAKPSLTTENPTDSRLHDMNLPEFESRISKGIIKTRKVYSTPNSSNEVVYIEQIKQPRKKLKFKFLVRK